MTLPINWISSDEFAETCQLPLRTAQYHVRLALQGKPSRKFPIVVRSAHGRGGRSGLRYEVLLASLPLHIQAAFNGLSEAPKKPVKSIPLQPRDPKSWPLAKKRYAIIEKALAHPAGSAERAQAIRAAECPGASQRTITRWIEAYEREGMGGLMMKKNATAGTARVLVTRQFDAAFLQAGYDPAILPELARYLDIQLKSLWASRAADGGANDLGRLASHQLLRECERRGIDLPVGVFRLHRRRIERDRRAFEQLNIMRTDAKRDADEQPRISRTYQNVDAMELVYIDVHHMDVCVTGPDGSTRWPKIVAFMDAGTGRVFPHFVLCESRAAVRQEHVIEGFIAMARHPEWGFPRNLYFDNGSENNALDRMAPALTSLRGGITRSIAYNAPAKPIEPLFKRLNQYCFKKMPGYVGGNRMVKKTQNVGKEPVPYPGTWAQFTATCHDLIAYYHQREMGGQWEDRSPSQVFQDKIDAGWRPITVHALELDAAFCDRKDYKLSRGVLRINGSAFTHEALLRLPHGERVEVALPWRRGADPVALLDDIGAVQLLPDYAYAPLDREGAKASGRRKQVARKAKRALAAETVTIDPVEIAADIGRRAKPIKLPARGYALDQGSAVQALADGRAKATENREAELTEAQRAKQRRDKITQNLLRKQANAA